MTIAADRRNEPRALRVLIADDDRDTVESLAFILRDEGHVVHAVYSGDEVLPATRLFRPDAAILDISIPGMSGYAAAQMIRNTFLDTRRPMLIAISGKWKARPDQMVAGQVGFDHHVGKPYHSMDILGLLQRLERPAPEAP